MRDQVAAAQFWLAQLLNIGQTESTRLKTMSNKWLLAELSCELGSKLGWRRWHLRLVKGKVQERKVSCKAQVHETVLWCVMMFYATPTSAVNGTPVLSTWVAPQTWQNTKILTRTVWCLEALSQEQALPCKKTRVSACVVNQLIASSKLSKHIICQSGRPWNPQTLNVELFGHRRAHDGNEREL